jgi:hypothetical protein
LALNEGSSKFTLDPDTFRLISTLGWGLWFGGTMVTAITVAAAAILALRTGTLPKWLAWLSVPVAVIMLFAILWIPFMVFCGWVLVVAVTLLVWKEAPESTAAAAAPA